MKPKKQLGQHWLSDDIILNQIADYADLSSINATNAGSNDARCATDGTGNPGALCRTFYNMSSLVGDGLAFVNNKLGGGNPSYSTQTFFGTGVTNAGLNWR